MNSCTLSGHVAGDSELRTLADGRELMDFQVMADGRHPGDSPTVHVAFFPRNGDPRKLTAGQRVVVIGGLRHRREVGGLFVAAREIHTLETPRVASEKLQTVGV